MSAPVDERADPDGSRRDGVDGADGSAGTHVVRHMSAGSPATLRVDFGAHLEANYQRLVAQLYAITLDPGEAHDVVQDAYSRAWRSWVAIGRTPDPSAWIRRVAVRSTIRSWRRVLGRFGIGGPRPIGTGVDPRTRALLGALRRLSPAERRAVVLFHMAGATIEEIAAVEQVSVTIVRARLSRGRQVVTEGMADVLPDVLGVALAEDGDGYDRGSYDSSDGGYAEGYRLDGPGSGAYGSYADGYGADGSDDEGERR